MGYDSTGSLSPEFQRFAPLFGKLEGPILDAPAGYGRHAFALQKLGCSVTCVDIDEKALAHIANEDKISSAKGLKRLEVLRHDLINEAWPFGANTFDGAVNVHFFHPGLIENLVYSLKTGGLLYVETIANRGGNYLELPMMGQLETKLRSKFRLILYKETAAGPAGSNKATVRLLGQKQ